MRIALMATCLADAMFPRAAQATVVLLERLGHEVVFPNGQTCCGQMHVNTGYAREALPLVRHHVGVFEQALDEGADAVVATAASLSASIAVDVSAFLSANVPPKPQHWSAPGSSTRSMSRTARSSRSGLSPTCSIRREWQVGW